MILTKKGAIIHGKFLGNAYQQNQFDITKFNIVVNVSTAKWKAVKLVYLLTHCLTTCSSYEYALFKCLQMYNAPHPKVIFIILQSGKILPTN